VTAVRFLAGRYRLIEIMGTGGMSVVWRAYDEVLARQVAVKLLAAELATEESSRWRLRAEAQAAACLAHPNVTNVFDYGESRGPDGTPTPYVVMELLEGVSLAERLDRGALPWRTAVRVCAEVAAALGTAHARGLVHRDIKPANVMLTMAGVKVVDFGIAAVSGDRSDLAVNGTLLGTPAYLAPERLLGAPVQPATDVYALGVMLYRALCGGLPWHAGTVTEMITAHCRADPAPLPDIVGLPPAVADACMRCLAKVPAQRPSSTEVARVLAEAVGVRVVLPAAAAVATGVPILDAGDARKGAAIEDDTLALVGVQTSLVPPAPGGSVTEGTEAEPSPAAARRRRRRLTRAGAVSAGLAAAALMVATCSAAARDAQPRRVLAAVQTTPGTGAGAATGTSGRTEKSPLTDSATHRDDDSGVDQHNTDNGANHGPGNAGKSGKPRRLHPKRN
jgi:eukaryotic-like serine/threonine-protein kinase